MDTGCTFGERLQAFLLKSIAEANKDGSGALSWMNSGVALALSNRAAR